MASLSRLIRPATLLVLAAIAVHELRFLVGFGPEDHALARGEHAYLALGLSTGALLLAAAIASFFFDLHRATAGTEGPAHRPPGFVRAWMAASGALVAVYVGQELLEGVIATGHPGGLAGVLGHAGWSALPFAVALGGLVAALLRGASSAIAHAASAGRAPSVRRSAPRAILPRRREVRRPHAAVLAVNLAGRAPPVPTR